MADPNERRVESVPGCDNLTAVKRKSSSTQSKTDWARLNSKDDDVSADADHPEADIRHIKNGVVRRGLKPQPPNASVSFRAALQEGEESDPAVTLDWDEFMARKRHEHAH